jgi:serine/threonine-protein kinase
MGGMGEIYRAVSEGPAGFSKVLVVKRILPHLARDASFVKLFLNEARLAALLSHPNIVQIFELGRDRDEYFIAMEYVDGRSLREIARCFRRRKLPFPPPLAAHIVAEALQGLHCAHTLCDSNGAPLRIVHRDVSPDNILVGVEGEVKVLDFGVARAASGVTTISATDAGVVRGKFAYLSPEIIEQRPFDRRADIYAAGVVLYELLAGVRPFEGDSMASLVRCIVARNPKPLNVRNPKVSPQLCRLVMKALSGDADRRFETAEAMSEALRAYLDSCGERVKSTQVRELVEQAKGISEVIEKAETLEVEPTRRRRSWFLPVAGAGAALALGVAAWSLSGKRGAAAPVAGTGAPSSPRAKAEQPAKVQDPPPPQAEPRPPPEPAPRAPPDAAPAPAEATLAGTTVLRDAAAAPASNGQVVIRVNPWAEVFFEGKRVGVTPMRPLVVPAGTRTFLLRNPELAIERTVRVLVPPNGQVVLKEDLLE